jgi:hypothetical protein
MLQTALIIFGLELVVIALARSRYRARGRVTQPTATST